MGKRVSPETSDRVQAIMFGQQWEGSDRDQFLSAEIERYIPQLASLEDSQIVDFVTYHRGLYLQGKRPIIGRPIASLNPHFVVGVSSIPFQHPGCVMSYTRAALKENGYRLQLHRGIWPATAFTRQFTPYDLRMFPELSETIEALPVMIGDSELINKHHRHLAGFNRVQHRIPQGCWPERGAQGLSADAIEAYLADPDLFVGPKPHQDLELTLAFHGLFAISDPSTWDKPRVVQVKHLISLMHLPIDYRRVDDILDQLGVYLHKHKLNARVVERHVVTSTAELQTYVDEQEKIGNEGTCVVQSGWDKNDHGVVVGHSIKIKKYETFDMILLGLVLKDRELGCVESNLKTAIVGLYDRALGVYLAATKVNLDSDGVQVKKDHQRDHLKRLRLDLVTTIQQKKALNVRDGAVLYSLADVYRMQGQRALSYLLGDTKLDLQAIVSMALPRGHDLVTLYKLYVERKKEYDSGMFKKPKAAEKAVFALIDFFKEINVLPPRGKVRFEQYFSKSRDIKTLSAGLVHPHVLVSTVDPIVIEIKVFNLKWGNSPFPAGFHSWFGNSFQFENNYPERIRHDKGSTTDYETVFAVARLNTFRAKKGAEIALGAAL